MTDNPSSFDVVIAGAGPAGLALACSLAGQGMRVALAERQSAAALAAPEFDGRDIALTRRSAAMLQDLGAWARITPAEIAPLGEARVWNGASLRALRFLPQGDDAPLGHLVSNHVIRHALFETAAASANISLFAGCRVTGLDSGAHAAALLLDNGTRLSAPLAVAADTRFSELRRMAGIGARMLDFGKTMLVCRMAHDSPHDTVATEWFGHGQTVAMLPLNPDGGHAHVSSLVITLPARQIAVLQALEPEAFAAEVARRCDWRLGEMHLLSTRHAYPLVAVYAARFAGARLALVGDAAVGMHPVTAHGFNFGLDGQQRLAALAGAAVTAGGDPGAPALLARYERQHMRGTLPLFLATNAAAQLYTDERLPARVLRDAALRFGTLLAPMRRALVSRLLQPVESRLVRT